MIKVLEMTEMTEMKWLKWLKWQRLKSPKMTEMTTMIEMKWLKWLKWLKWQILKCPKMATPNMPSDHGFLCKWLVCFRKPRNPPTSGNGVVESSSELKKLNLRRNNAREKETRDQKACYRQKQQRFTIVLQLFYQRFTIVLRSFAPGPDEPID